jgi:hypothetical protein
VARIDSVYDFSDKALVELKSWLEPWFQSRAGAGGVGWEDVGISCGATYSSVVTSEPTLVAYWPLNEASGNALDASGNGHPMLAANFSGPPTQGSPGPFPRHPTTTSYTFGGYIQRSDSALAGAGTGLTLECWIYPTSAPAVSAFFVQFPRVPSGYVSYQFQFRSGRNIFWVVANTHLADSVVTVPLNTWTYVVGTSSVADGLRLYLNGAQVATGSSAVPSSLATNMGIGQGDDSGGSHYPFTGRMAQIALYDSVLDHYQVGTLI